MKRTVKSRPGMSQEEALQSLQSHPMFKAGTKIASLRRRGKVWVAALDEPGDDAPFGEEKEDKKPAFMDEPDADVDVDSADEDDNDDKAPDFEGFDEPDAEGDIDSDSDEDSKEDTDHKMLDLLEQILDAVKPHHEPDGDEMGDMGLDIGEDKPMPPMPPMPKAPAGGAPKPGVPSTPIGSPAFASATFVASRPANVTIKQAKAELEAEYGAQGYSVKKIKREGDVLKALVSKR